MRKLGFFILIIFALICCFNASIEAQESVIDGAYAREHVPKREMVPYQGIREADAMYSKRVLRKIDLDEKINHPLYFPRNPIHYPGGQQPERSRVSLIYLLYRIGIMHQAEAERQMVFKFNLSDFNNWYKDPILPEDTIGRTEFLTYKQETVDENGNPITVDRDIELFEVKSYLMWEEWVFDKQRSVMDVRIIAIAPVAEYVELKNGMEEHKVKRLFWIPFPQYRPLLSKYEVFNVQNDSERRTFDDVFAQRRFESYLIVESNVYDNRQIRDYLLGIDAMHEGKKIEDELFRFEHDLWEY